MCWFHCVLGEALPSSVRNGGDFEAASLSVLFGDWDFPKLLVFPVTAESLEFFTQFKPFLK
jgi:hypothetical protein